MWSTSPFEVAVIETPGLGNRSYLVASGDEAVAIDPPRDGWRVAAAAAERGWRIRASLETHVHNDYLSGARELRRSLRAGIVAPAAGRYRFAHRPVGDGDEVGLGSVGLVARATPGHTPEHLAWEVRDGSGRPLAVFTGGSLLIGGVGRTDLLGPRMTAELTAAQFATMRRLAELPDDVLVYPTHGAGSFCVAGPSAGPASGTIGSLRRWNDAFTAEDPAAFGAAIVTARTRYPAYYERIAPLNRRGPRLLGGPPEVPELAPADVAALQARGTPVIDVRDRRSFAAGHVRGALNIELDDDSLAAYVGWLLPFDSPLVLAAGTSADATEAALELLRIGYDHVLGWLDGVAAWQSAGLPTGRIELVSWRDLQAQAAGADPGPARILDVRQPAEWSQGAIPGSRRIFVADLPAALGRLDRSDTWTVACRSGARTAIASSILAAAGIPIRSVADGGVPSLPAAALEPG